MGKRLKSVSKAIRGYQTQYRFQGEYVPAEVRRRAAGDVSSFVSLYGAELVALLTYRGGLSPKEIAGAASLLRGQG